jgi:hypothetical protein
MIRISSIAIVLLTSGVATSGFAQDGANRPRSPVATLSLSEEDRQTLRALAQAKLDVLKETQGALRELASKFGDVQVPIRSVGDLVDAEGIKKVRNGIERFFDQQIAIVDINDKQWERIDALVRKAELHGSIAAILQKKFSQSHARYLRKATALRDAGSVYKASMREVADFSERVIGKFVFQDGDWRLPDAEMSQQLSMLFRASETAGKENIEAWESVSFERDGVNEVFRCALSSQPDSEVASIESCVIQQQVSSVQQEFRSAIKDVATLKERLADAMHVEELVSGQRHFGDSLRAIANWEAFVGRFERRSRITFDLCQALLNDGLALEEKYRRDFVVIIEAFGRLRVLTQGLVLANREHVAASREIVVFLQDHHRSAVLRDDEVNFSDDALSQDFERLIGRIEEAELGLDAASSSIQSLMSELRGSQQ